DGRRALAPDLSARASDASARASEDPDIGIKQ
ncbi:sulfurtransferase, partial [Pseudomonas sp. FW300-N1A1]